MYTAVGILNFKSTAPQKAKVPAVVGWVGGAGEDGQEAGGAQGRGRGREALRDRKKTCSHSTALYVRMRAIRGLWGAQKTPKKERPGAN